MNTYLAFGGGHLVHLFLHLFHLGPQLLILINGAVSL